MYHFSFLFAPGEVRLDLGPVVPDGALVVCVWHSSVWAEKLDKSKYKGRRDIGHMQNATHERKPNMKEHANINNMKTL